MGRKIFLAIIGFLFLLFAYFQWNDPDSLKWIMYYILVASLFFLSLANKNKRLYSFMVLGFSIVWLITLFPSALEWFKDGMPSIVDSMQASTPYIELVREFLGLLISSLLITLLIFLEKNKK